jgi:cytochrome P450
VLTVFDTFATTSDTLVSQLETERESGKPVDLQAYFFKYTMVPPPWDSCSSHSCCVQDSFGLIAFNAEFRTLEGETAEYGEAFDGAHESVAMFFRKFALLATLLEVFDEKSWLRKAIEAVVHPLIPEIQRLKKERRTMREYTAKVIADRKSCTNEERLASKDILGMFIKAAEEQEIAQSDEYLTDVVLNLVIAGRDTTACLLSWTFYELARHPDVLRTLREHLEGVDVDDFHSIKHQPYLTALLYEGGCPATAEG